MEAKMGKHWNYIRNGSLQERSYQLRDCQEILDRGALGENVGLVYPTGLGKTWTAFMVMDHYLSSGKVLFLAHTNALAMQHCHDCQATFNLPSEKIALFNGRLGQKKRALTMQQSLIVFATPQTVVNAMRQGQVDLAEFSLVVFDEMHMADKKYDYVVLARECRKYNIRVLGLTASTGDADKIEQIELNYDLRWWVCHFTDEEEIKPYFFDKKQKRIIFEANADHLDGQNMLLDAIYTMHNALAHTGLVPKIVGKVFSTDPSPFLRLTQLRDLRPRLNEYVKRNQADRFAWNFHVYYAAYFHLAHLLYLYTTESYELALQYINFLAGKLIPVGGYGVYRFNAASIIWKNEMFHRFRRLLLYFGQERILHPKTVALKSLVLNFEIERKRVLIFCNSKQSIDILLRELTSWGIKARLIAGTKFMKVREQEEQLAQFKNDEFPVLLATSVIEAGIHVPKIDVLINYSIPLTGIAHIQRGGRVGRTEVGLIYHFVMENSGDENMYYAMKAENKSMVAQLRRRLLAQADRLQGRRPTTTPNHQLSFQF